MVPDADSADPADTDSARTIKAAAEATGAEAAHAARVETTSVEAAEAAAKPVDEERRRPVAAGQITFEHIDVKSQPVALKLRCLQHHDGIADFRPVRAEHRDGGVRRILVKAVCAIIARRPFVHQISRERMPCRPHRAVRENDRVGRHAGECQFSALQAGATGVHHDQRRHDIRAGLADRLLQRHVLRRRGLGQRRCCPAEQEGDNHAASSTLDGHDKLL